MGLLDFFSNKQKAPTLTVISVRFDSKDDYVYKSSKPRRFYVFKDANSDNYKLKITFEVNELAYDHDNYIKCTFKSRYEKFEMQTRNDFPTWGKAMKQINKSLEGKNDIPSLYFKAAMTAIQKHEDQKLNANQTWIKKTFNNIFNRENY